MQISKLKLKAQKHSLLLFSTVYFFFRLTNLTNLPIFNDEAIYLDWAWRMTHEPGFLFYSLYDAKQPLIMWLFGIAENIFSDPLFAGRFVSVLFGWLTFLGIYTISKTYVDTKTAHLASLLYIIIPIFSFYDRQALMEAAIGAIGIWSLWFALKAWVTGSQKAYLLTGLILGIGFLIKTSGLVFVATFFLVSVVFLVKRSKHVSVKKVASVLMVFLATNTLLFLQPIFWETLSSNSRYGYGLSGLLQFPIQSWLGNLLGNLEIMFFFLTPFVLLTILSGLFLFFRNREIGKRYILAWILLTILLQTILVKGTTQRYLVSFLPLLTIYSAYTLTVMYVSLKNNILVSLGIGLVMLVPLLLTLLQILNPPLYFRNLDIVTRFSEGGAYVHGQTAGYGINETIAYLENMAKGRNIFVGQAVYTGTPESAVTVAFQKSKTVTVGYLDRQLFGDALNDIDCLQTDLPVYFMSKGKDVAGLEKFLENITFLRNPYNANVIGIWKLKKDCEGKALPVQLVNTR